MLNLIQLGITLSDEQGNFPSPTSTWQFNLQYNLSKEKYNQESIKMLQESGIDFDSLKHKGIDPLVLGDYLISSGLFLNEDTKWITFHGAFDYAYLIKLLCNQKLPDTYDSYKQIIGEFFPTTYDTKIIANEVDDIKGTSLQKLGNEFGIERTGIQHQAGSDALLTLKCYLELCKKFDKNKIPRRMANRVYGLGSDFHNVNMIESTFEMEPMNAFLVNNFYMNNNYGFHNAANPATQNYFMQ